MLYKKLTKHEKIAILKFSFFLSLAINTIIISLRLKFNVYSTECLNNVIKLFFSLINFFFIKYELY